MAIKKPTIVSKLQKINKFGRPGTNIVVKKIAIHYTGQADVKGINTVSYFNNVVANGYKVNGKYVFASAHFVIDLDGTIYQLIPIDEKCYCTNSANSYAIGIEVATTGSDNHYTDEAYRSMVWLCAWLCQYKGLNCIEDIITHTDVVGKDYKLCPIYMVKNPSKMKQFKLDCQNLKDEKIEINDIVNCTDGKGKVTIVPSKTQYLRVIADEVNVHNAANFDADSVCGVIEKGCALTIVKKIERTGTDMYLTKAGIYITASSKYVEVFSK